MQIKQDPSNQRHLSLRKSVLCALSLIPTLVSGCGLSQSQQINDALAKPKTQSEATSPQSLTKPSSSAENDEILHVAVIGDSQSTGGYGQRLSDLILNAAKQRLVYFGAASSARISSWTYGGFSPIPANAYFGCDSETDARSCKPSMRPGQRTEPIATIIKNNPYVDLYILTLGDNHIYDPASVRSELPALVKPILKSGARCAFITPTVGVGRFSDKETLISYLKSALDGVKSELGSTCSFIDSYHVGQRVLKTQSDLQTMRNASAQDPMGLHPQGSGARLWGERVFETLVNLGLLDRL